MNEYDVRKAFEEMELELIASMKRNLQRHLDWENEEGFNWNMWQAEQLKALKSYERNNRKIFKKKFKGINREIKNFISDNYKNAALSEEIKILKQINQNDKLFSIQRIVDFINNHIHRNQSETTDIFMNNTFFKLNTSKLDALLNAVENDMQKAEHAMLRMANDQYRKTIFNAQVMANSGAFTLQQSIDKATKGFLKAGINCIQYKNGRRVNIASYAEMAIRTANKRAVLISEGDARNAYSIHTVRISKYGGCSETCLPWQGRVYVDDVFSGGTKEEAQEKKLPLLSEAIEGGLFHPNCKHRATTYFYDLKKSLGKLEEDGVENPLEEQEHRKNMLHIQQQKRLEIGSLDPASVQQAQIRKEQWIEKDELLLQTGALSGAWNNYNDPMNKNREKIAADLYNEIINRKKEFEIKAVAKNSGFTVENIERIYNHIFIREHLFLDGEIHKFYPDYYMAHSWIRIRDGKKIYKHDMTMLYHELEEEKIMGDSLEVVYETTHKEVEKKYNYRKELLEYLEAHDV